MQRQPPPGEISRDPLPPILEHRRVVLEQREIVDVAQIALWPQHFGAEMIEAIQVDIGEELACQIADWQTAPTQNRGQEIIAQVMDVNRLLRVGAVDDRIGQP